MLELIERLIMLELSKEIAKSQAAEQKNILDTILDGAQKAAQVVNNIKCISAGDDPKPTSPLYEKEPVTMPTKEAPTPPSFAAKSFAPKDPIAMVSEAIESIRSHIETVYQQRSIAKSDLEPIMSALYDLHLDLYEKTKK
jgi:hypothetical protein